MEVMGVMGVMFVHLPGFVNPKPQTLCDSLVVLCVSVVIPIARPQIRNPPSAIRNSTDWGL